MESRAGCDPGRPGSWKGRPVPGRGLRRQAFTGEVSCQEVVVKIKAAAGPALGERRRPPIGAIFRVYNLCNVGLPGGQPQ